MTGFVLAILTAIVVTAYNLCARAWVTDSGSPLAFSILYTIFAAILSLGILFVEPWQFVDVSSFWIVALITAGLLYGMYDATQFSARKYVEASTLSLFSQLAPLIAFALAVLVLKEEPTLMRIVAVICIIVGNIIVLFKPSGNALQLRGLSFGLAAALFTGLAYFVDKTTFQHFPMALYAVTVYVIPAAVVSIIFLLTGGKRADVAAELKRATWKVPALAAIGVTGFYCLLKTYEITPLSVAIPLVYSATILTTLGGIFLLNERSGIWRKMIGAVFVFAGVILLS